MLWSQNNIKVVPKIFGYNLFISEKSILYITVRNIGKPVDTGKRISHQVSIGLVGFRDSSEQYNIIGLVVRMLHG